MVEQFNCMQLPACLEYLERTHVWRLPRQATMHVGKHVRRFVSATSIQISAVLIPSSGHCVSTVLFPTMCAVCTYSHCFQRFNMCLNHFYSIHPGSFRNTSIFVIFVCRICSQFVPIVLPLIIYFQFVSKICSRMRFCSPCFPNFSNTGCSSRDIDLSLK